MQFSTQKATPGVPEAGDDFDEGSADEEAGEEGPCDDDEEPACAPLPKSPPASWSTRWAP